MLATKISGAPALAARVESAACTLVRNASTVVICATVRVQASIAPISIVTYWAPCPAAICAWAGSADDPAPDLASLKTLTKPVAPAARSRCRCELTDVVDPVDQLLVGHDVRLEHVIAACVIESPSAAMRVIVAGAGAACAAEAALSVPVRRRADAANAARARRARVVERMSTPYVVVTRGRGERPRPDERRRSGGIAIPPGSDLPRTIHPCIAPATVGEDLPQWRAGWRAGAPAQTRAAASCRM